jgi:hypothetical protein
MKKIIYIITLFILSVTSTYGQTARKSRFPVGNFHQINTNISGLSVGLYSLGDDERNTHTNGIKLEIIGLGIILPLVPKDPLTDANFATEDFSEQINGMSISGTGTVCNCLINGISLGTISQLVTKINGFSGALMFNLAVEHNGLQLGAMNAATKMRGVQLSLFGSSASEAMGLQFGAFNSMKKGRGLQIGLFNDASHFKGIQLGLYNKNQRRTTPFINWNFKD